MKNVVLIMTDEHNHNVMGCAGNEVAQTPNLDLLAESGTLITDCYTTYPLCVPSRLSFLTGQYCSEIKAWHNGAKLDKNTLTLPHALSKEKVNSILSGKMHLASGQQLGYLTTGPNLYNARTGARVSPKEKSVKPLTSFGLKFNKVEVNRNHIHDQVTTRKACTLLERNPKEPFFLTVGYISPHFPLSVPAQRYIDMFMDKVKMPDPHIPAHKHAVAIHRKLTDRGMTQEATRKALAAYYGLTNWVDERVGEVLNSLNSTSLSERTTVIYTSDHGDMLGQHGLWMKGCLYEGAARVPLIIADGKHKGVRRNVCSHLDVSRTIAKTLGVEDFGRGRDLQPLLDGKQWTDLAFAQHFGPRLPGSKFMVRHGEWKYIYTTKRKERELYNLIKDPNEKVNLAEEYHGKCVSFHKRMVDEFGGYLGKFGS